MQKIVKKFYQSRKNLTLNALLSQLKTLNLSSTGILFLYLSKFPLSLFWLIWISCKTGFVAFWELIAFSSLSSRILPVCRALLAAFIVVLCNVDDIFYISSLDPKSLSFSRYLPLHQKLYGMGLFPGTWGESEWEFRRN